ncbi:Trimethylguanosine synthase, partial [Fragariocoptes setiger]
MDIYCIASSSPVCFTIRGPQKVALAVKETATTMSLARRSFKKPVNKDLHKYYQQRFKLFSRFDDGIILDDESWYSVTPELIAIHVAERVHRSIGNGKHAVIVDGFVGAGGNLIQFACMSPDSTIIGCDINLDRLQMAKHNARIYGVHNQCQFIYGDFMHIVRALRSEFIDAIFLSPPWGGVHYKQHNKYSLSMMTPNGYDVMLACRSYLTKNIAFLMPRNVDFDELKQQLLDVENPTFEFEQNQVGKKIKTITVYFGDLIDENAESGGEDNAHAPHKRPTEYQPPRGFCGSITIAQTRLTTSSDNIGNIANNNVCQQYFDDDELVYNRLESLSMHIVDSSGESLTPTATASPTTTRWQTVSINSMLMDAIMQLFESRYSSQIKPILTSSISTSLSSTARVPLHLASNTCKRALQKFMCHFVYPACHYRRHDTVPLARPPCRQDCLALRHSLCAHHDWQADIVAPIEATINATLEHIIRHSQQSLIADDEDNIVPNLHHYWPHEHSITDCDRLPEYSTLSAPFLQILLLGHTTSPIKTIIQQPEGTSTMPFADDNDYMSLESANLNNGHAVNKWPRCSRAYLTSIDVYKANDRCIDARRDPYGEFYVGHVNITRSRRTCLAWGAAEMPDKHLLLFESLLEFDVDGSSIAHDHGHNHCRNPGARETAPWCYVDPEQSHGQYSNPRAAVTPIHIDFGVKLSLDRSTYNTFSETVDLTGNRFRNLHQHSVIPLTDCDTTGRLTIAQGAHERRLDACARHVGGLEIAYVCRYVDKFFFTGVPAQAESRLNLTKRTPEFALIQGALHGVHGEPLVAPVVRLHCDNVGLVHKPASYMCLANASPMPEVAPVISTCLSADGLWKFRPRLSSRYRRRPKYTTS